MPDIDPNRWSEVTPDWWGVVAGAAVAGAVLVPAHRVVAGALAGAAALALALYQLPSKAGNGGSFIHPLGIVHPDPTNGGDTGIGGGLPGPDVTDLFGKGHGGPMPCVGCGG